MSSNPDWISLIGGAVLTLLNAVLVIVINGVRQEFRGLRLEFKEMNGSLKSLTQWKTDHIGIHLKDWDTQRLLCDLRHPGGRRSYDPLFHRIEAPPTVEETP